LKTIALCFCVALTLLVGMIHADEPISRTPSIFKKNNLVAWCIVPFDKAKRDPEQRAKMLRELGISRLAYDYRAEHVAQFETEILTLKKYDIELTAWWFPTTLNDEAKIILELLGKHHVKPQLWVMGGGDIDLKGEAEENFIKSELDRLKPIAEAAEQVGCKVGLYNHGGWFGEPENQLKLIERLKMPNVGIVYNLHHSHDQVDRIESLLPVMFPHLIALNINGTQTNGDKEGKKILPIGEGDLDRELIGSIIRSGYAGPVGILNHTDEDAQERLHDNLDGLNWVLDRLNGSLAAKPIWRSYPEKR
jgi:sugar phosphate isomerase/epimerase